MLLKTTTALATAILLTCVGCGQREVSYSQDVFPIVWEHCAECHSGGGEGESASGFSVATYEDLMKGTQYGQVIVPDSAISSTLYHMISGTVDPSIEMPPHAPDALAEGRGEPLTEEQIQTVRTWIDQGAQNN